MSRRPLVCANWKMNQTASEAETWALAFASAIEPHRTDLAGACEIAVAPSHPVLDRLGRALDGSGIHLAAQNVHAEESGAFTGEVSVAMLEDLGCRYALIGHSERRQLFGERDAGVAAKAERLQGSSVRPILCVGETLDEREHGQTLDVVRTQLGAVLDRASGLGEELVVAYEPVWAIGTGKTATPEIAQDVHAALRATMIERLGETGNRIRLLYGGSVKPSNASELLSQADIDGALVGGASLAPQDFAQIALATLT